MSEKGQGQGGQAASSAASQMLIAAAGSPEKGQSAGGQAAGDGGQAAQAGGEQGRAPWEPELDYSPPPPEQPTDVGSQPAGGGGGGSVAGATEQPELGEELGTDAEEADTRPWTPMSGEIEFEDGSRMRDDGRGNRVFTDSAGREWWFDGMANAWRHGDEFQPPGSLPTGLPMRFEDLQDNWSAGDWQQHASDLQNTMRHWKAQGLDASDLQKAYDEAVANSRRMQGID